MRKCVAILLTGVISALTWVGAGTAAAEPQLPSWSLIGNNYGTFGDNHFCHGALGVGLTAPKGKRGVLRITFTSYGFTGTNPGWKKDPKCRMFVTARITSGNQLLFDHNFPAEFGSRPGQKVTRDIVTGSGLIIVMPWTYSRRAPGVPLSYGSSIFAIVP